MRWRDSLRALYQAQQGMHTLGEKAKWASKGAEVFSRATHKSTHHENHGITCISTIACEVMKSILRSASTYLCAIVKSGSAFIPIYMVHFLCMRHTCRCKQESVTADLPRKNPKHGHLNLVLYYYCLWRLLYGGVYIPFPFFLFHAGFFLPNVLRMAGGDPARGRETAGWDG